MREQPDKVTTYPTPPILTEVAEATFPDIPTLTEVHDPITSTPVQNNSAEAVEPLSAAACDYLVAQIAPQIDALLQNAILDIQARLPELIRSALDKQQAAKQND